MGSGGSKKNDEHHNEAPAEQDAYEHAAIRLSPGNVYIHSK